MDPEYKRVERHYELIDLGIMHGPPLKGTCIVTEMANEVLQSRVAAFVVFDAVAGEVILRAAAPKLRAGTTYPLHRSAIRLSDEPPVTMAIDDLAKDAPESSEATTLGMGSMLAASVFGPDEQPVGALVAFGDSPRSWTDTQKRKIVDLAYLITQEIVLLASFATLEIITTEGVPHRA